MKKKLSKILVAAIIFTFLLPFSSAWYYDWDDDWTYSGSSDSDKTTWKGYDIKWRLKDITDDFPDTDCVCIDWFDGDSPSDDKYFKTWDTCFCRSNSALSDCKKASKLVKDVCSRSSCWKANPESWIDMDTKSGSNNMWENPIDARIYESCRDGLKFRNLENSNFYVINPKRIMCDNSKYDYEGQYSSDKWHIYNNDNSCSNSKACDPHYDDKSL